MPDQPQTWILKGFIERLDAWIDLEDPDQDLRMAVTAWVLTRQIDPYEGVERDAGFANLWFGTVPHSLHDDARVVVCSYWILEAESVVRCDTFGTLGLPL